MATTVRINIVGTDAASPAFDRVAASADRAASKIMVAGKRMNEAGKTLTHTLTLPIVGAVAASADLATRFQSAMEKIHTQAGGSQKDVISLSKAVLDMSKSTQQGPVQLANALYHLKSVGMSNAQAMKALGVTTKLAAVGGADLEETTNALAGAWRTGIKGAQNFGQAAATVNAIIGAGNMTMADFTAAIGTGILPVAKTFGLSLNQVGAALALFTDEGVPATDAATRFRMSIALMGAPSKIATKWLGTIHLNALSLAEAMRHPGTGLIDAVTLLKTHLDKFGGSAAKQSMILARAFGGGRSSASIMSMVNNLDVLGKKQSQVNLLMARFGGAVKSQAETAQAKFHTMVSNLERSAILLGNQVLPYVTKLATGVGNMAQKFGDLPAAKQRMILFGALAVAALGPVLRIVGNLTRAIGFLAKTTFALASFAGGVVRAAVRVVGGFAMMTTSALTYESTAYQMGLKARMAFESLGSTAMATGKLLVSGAAGAAIGYGLGKITQNSSIAAKAVSGLASAAAGAAVGFAVGGPLGAAVGGVTGLVVNLVTGFHHSGSAAAAAAKAAQAAMLAEKQAAEDLFQELQAVNGSYNAMYKSAIVQKLGASGALAIAAKAGVKLPALVNSILTGDTGANTKAFAAMGAEITRAFFAGKITTAQYNRLNAAIKQLTPASAQAEKRFELENAAMGRGVIAASKLGSSMKRVQEAFYGTGRALEGTSASAERNRAVLKQEVTAFAGASVKALQHGKSLGVVAKQYEGNVAALKKHMISMGFDKQTTADLIKEYERIPQQRMTKLLADATQGRLSARQLQADINAIKQNRVPWLRANSIPGQQAIAALQNAIDRMHGKTLYINARVQATTSYAPVQIPVPRSSPHPQGRQFYAAGGRMRDGRSVVGENGPEVVDKHGNAVRVYANDSAVTRATLAAWGVASRAYGNAGSNGTRTGKIADTVIIQEASDARATAREVAREQRRRAQV